MTVSLLSEEDMVNITTEALSLYDEQCEEDGDGLIKGMVTFEEAGMLTMDNGLIVTTKFNQKFAITVKKL